MYVIRNGKVEIGHWPPYRKAVEAAMTDLGIAKLESGSIPQEVWNIGVATAEQFREQNKLHCFKCRKIVDQGDDIRCLDCRAVYCPRCAEEHFWPQGRPKDDRHG